MRIAIQLKGSWKEGGDRTEVLFVMTGEKEEEYFFLFCVSVWTENAYGLKMLVLQCF